MPMAVDTLSLPPAGTGPEPEPTPAREPAPVAWGLQIPATGEIRRATGDPKMRDYWMRKYTPEREWPPEGPKFRVVPLCLRTAVCEPLVRILVAADRQDESALADALADAVLVLPDEAVLDLTRRCGRDPAVVAARMRQVVASALAAHRGKGAS